MLRLLVVLAGMSIFIPAAKAEPSSAVAFDRETLALLAAADPARGEALAASEKCARCHGEAGVSEDPDDINIAGLSASYIYKQLVDYRDENRDSRDMLKRVRNLDEQQLADLAVWFASLEPASTAADRAADPEILRLVYQGDPRRMIKACASCHGRDGRGGQFDHPALAGQQRGYLITSLEEFRDGDRTNDIYSRMRYVAAGLTDEEVEALAAYYAVAEAAE